MIVALEALERWSYGAALAKKRAVIYAALAEFRDSTRNVMTRDERLMMGHHMRGIEARGGPAVGLLRPGPAAQHDMPMPMNPEEERP